MSLLYFLPLFTVCLGFILANFIPANNKSFIKLLLAFSGAYLLGITIFHFVPEIFYKAITNKEMNLSNGHIHTKIGVFIILGIFFQILLEYFSKGAEHGHVHTSKKNKMPWVLFFSLFIHALLEGMPLIGNTELIYGIAVHHLPIAIILTGFFNQTVQKKWITFCFIIAFALATPIGSFLALNVGFFNTYKQEISGIVIGILFHISSTIIFESTEAHTFNLKKILSILIGFLCAFLS